MQMNTVAPTKIPAIISDDMAMFVWLMLKRYGCLLKILNEISVNGAESSSNQYQFVSDTNACFSTIALSKKDNNNTAPLTEIFLLDPGIAIQLMINRID